MIATIINDCRDANAQGRQTTRLASLIKAPVNFIGVQNELEAAGTLIDVLDAYGEEQGVILANVAPRDHQGKKWPNGTPFGYFYHNNVLVLSSIDGLVLSLAKKLGLFENIFVTDIPTVLPILAENGLLPPSDLQRVRDSQFRSFDYLPRLAAFLLAGGKVPTTSLGSDHIPDAPRAVWFVDNFGNCKTTILEPELDSSTIVINAEPLPFVPRLKDIEDDSVSTIIGSSGLESKRFVEVAKQGGRACDACGLSVGSLL